MKLKSTNFKIADAEPQPTGTSKITKKKDALCNHEKQKSFMIAKKTHETKITGIDASFFVRFHTVPGQNLYIIGSHPLLGMDKNPIAMEYFDENSWIFRCHFEKTNFSEDNFITYRYILEDRDGSYHYDSGSDKQFNPFQYDKKELVLIDTWNFAGLYFNAFMTEPFQKVLLKNGTPVIYSHLKEDATHLFKIKAPLLKEGEIPCILGAQPELGQWNADKAVPLHKSPDGDYYEASINLIEAAYPIQYKYGTYSLDKETLCHFESGEDRLLFDYPSAEKLSIINDGFFRTEDNGWKGAGLAIPVFSLRSEKSMGCGEFTDLISYVDWIRQLGFKMIQILPINDTISTFSWIDSYPYAAISAFALHPIYLNLDAITPDNLKNLLNSIKQEGKRLNELPEVDYPSVLELKLSYARKIFNNIGDEVLDSDGFKGFFGENKEWLLPYAAFCCLRDRYRNADFSTWDQEFRTYNETVILNLSRTDQHFDQNIRFYYFIQYQLHLQLKQATTYAHHCGVILKGDIAIGVARNGVDTWQNPDLYHLDMQAGAPPDAFAIKGQNWSFPTYNWETMKQDNYKWWKQRFKQMSYYFDAFRIDHILGFFRIWSIPQKEVEGIMGHFVPAIPVHRDEFHQRSIYFDLERYTKPYITEEIIENTFGTLGDLIRKVCLRKNEDHYTYSLLDAYATQKSAEQSLLKWEDQKVSKIVKQGIFNLISNVILFEEPGSKGNEFHFRFAINDTQSFHDLDESTRNKLYDLYIDYYFRRQDDFWKKKAMEKLPALKRETNMLICGEDLGLVPSCVPVVMKMLGLLSLEIQRMPKEQGREFFNPADAPYLSVVTPSSHDMSTIRGWWEEDRQTTQRFFNNELHMQGEAPYYCEPWINESIVRQHLASPAMWSIFQIQDLFGIDGNLRRIMPSEERINIPSEIHHYWNYRVHISIEKLLDNKEFSDKIASLISGYNR